MAPEDTFNYKVKESIVTQYKINEEVYQHMFGDPDIPPNEKPEIIL